MISNILKYLLSTIVFYSLYINALAQDDMLNKEVVVVKPYTPTLSDAKKMNTLPSVNDSTIIKTDVEYFVFPYEMAVDYTPKPINAAKMLGVPLPKLYQNYARVGMGTYTTPMAEIIINSDRNKDYLWNGRFFHESSFGKVKLDNDKKVNAGYSDTELELFGKKILKSSSISANLDLYNHRLHHYGYDPLIDTTLTKDETKQWFSGFSSGLRWQSMNINDSSKVNYDVTANFDGLIDYFKNKENVLTVQADIDKYIKDNKLGIITGYKKYFTPYDTSDFSYFNFKPYLSRYSDKWKVHAGLDFYIFNYAGNSLLHYYPLGYLEYNVMKNYISPFAGVSGKLEINDYQKMINENPFITPGLSVKNSDQQIGFYGGFKGLYSSKISYNFKYTYAVIDNFYMFVNEQNTILKNRFTVIYDEAEYTNYFGEITYRPSKKLFFALRGNQHHYKLIYQEKAWHRPDWDATFSTHYNIQDKIIVNLDILGIGKQYAKTFDNSQFKELPSYFDVNLGVEYKYTKVLGFFMTFNNISAQKQYIYNQYPAQRFRFMAGLSYAL